MKNFTVIKAELITLRAEDDKRQTEIKGLQASVAMLVRENQVLKQRIGVLQAGQVLGRTDGD